MPYASSSIYQEPLKPPSRIVCLHQASAPPPLYSEFAAVLVLWKAEPEFFLGVNVHIKNIVLVNVVDMLVNINLVLIVVVFVVIRIELFLFVVVASS